MGQSAALCSEDLFKSTQASEDEERKNDIPAVTTGKPVNTRLGAVTSTMPTGVAIDTFDFDPLHQSTLFLATTSSVTHFCDYLALFLRSPPSTQRKFLLTTAVIALGNLSIVREASVLKALKVLFRVGGPAFLEVRALRLRAEVERNDVLAVQLALEVDQADAVADWFLLPR